jgi:hypothetical protein
MIIHSNGGGLSCPSEIGPICVPRGVSQLLGENYILIDRVKMFPQRTLLNLARSTQSGFSSTQIQLSTELLNNIFSSCDNN